MKSISERIDAFLHANTLLEATLHLDFALAQVRKTGVHGMANTDLVALCTEWLACPELAAEHVWWLQRLSGAGLSPIYSIYVGGPVLLLNVDRSADSSEIGRQTAQTLHDFLRFLLEVPELTDHEQRAKLEICVEKLLELTRELAFGVQVMRQVAPALAKLTLVPESAHRDELIFLRVVQGTELVFQSTNLLLERAMEAVGYSDAVTALGALYWITSLQRFLLPLLRLLSPMSVKNWLAIRPLIARPSAIQSLNFHRLHSQLSELQRIIDHPRYADHQLPYVKDMRHLVDTALKQFAVWYLAHTKIAAKYGQASSDYVPDGVAWLRRQQVPTETAETNPMGSGYD